MKIKIHVTTNKVGSRVEREVEVPDEDLEGLDENERFSHLNEIAQEEHYEMYEWGWEEA